MNSHTSTTDRHPVIDNKRPWYEATADKHATDRNRDRKPGQCACGACVTARNAGYRPQIS
jgi:hypothetical protein